MARPSAAQMRARALKQISGSTMDTEIDAAIVAADQVLAAHCLFPEYAVGLRSVDRDVSGTYTLHYDGPDLNDPRTLTLGLRPIASITAVTQDINAEWTYTETLVENTDFVLDKEKGKLYWHPMSVKPFRYGRRSIRVVMTAGFDLDSHETWMQALALTIHSWLPLRSANLHTTQMSQGSQSATLDTPTTIPKIVREMLSPYVLWERQHMGVY